MITSTLRAHWPTCDVPSATEPLVRHILLPVVTPQASGLLDLSQYSSLLRVLRVTAWIIRFWHNTSGAALTRTGPLAASEIVTAESYWVRQVQHESFYGDILALKGRQPIRAWPIVSLHPFLDKEGVLRVSGRPHNLDATEVIRHTAILPNGHRFSYLLIMDTHQRLLHAGTETTLLEVRERYWIVKGRQTVKRVLRACLTCRRDRLQPSEPAIAPIQSDRLVQTTPFETIGVDFAGPLYVKGTPPSSKAYIALFSSAVTRALHLELVSDMSAHTFLLAFRRFVARRGIPSIVHSTPERFTAAPRSYKLTPLSLPRRCKTLQVPGTSNGVSPPFARLGEVDGGRG